MVFANGNSYLLGAPHLAPMWRWFAPDTRWQEWSSN